PLHRLDDAVPLREARKAPPDLEQPRRQVAPETAAHPGDRRESRSHDRAHLPVLLEALGALQQDLEEIADLADEAAHERRVGRIHALPHPAELAERLAERVHAHDLPDDGAAPLLLELFHALADLVPRL